MKSGLLAYSFRFFILPFLGELIVYQWSVRRRPSSRRPHSDEFDFGPEQTTHFGVTCP